MQEININIDNRIGLAHAARLMGYHQDYLGQLCRAGKLKAVKLGRNWFTSEEAINEFKRSLAEAVEQVAQQQAQARQEMEAMQAEQESGDETTAPAPQMTETIVVSQVSGMPIALQTRPVALQQRSTIQSLITNLKISQLEGEMASVKAIINELATEVRAHSVLLQSKPWLMENGLRSTYASSFDFHPVTHQHLRTLETNSAPEIIVAPRLNWSNWAFAGALGVVAVVGVLHMFSGQFFGSTQSLTVRYAPAVTGDVAGVTSPEVITPLSIEEQALQEQQKFNQLNNTTTSQTISGAPVGELLQ